MLYPQTPSAVRSALRQAANRVARQLHNSLDNSLDNSWNRRLGAGARSAQLCEALESRRLMAATPPGAAVADFVDPSGVTLRALTVTGTNKADSIEIQRTASGSLLVNVNGNSQEITEPVQKITILGLGGADNLRVFDTTTASVAGVTVNGVFLDGVTIDGGGGNDSITGGNGNDNLIGSGGSDVIIGGAGNDHIDGGAGNDRMTGGKGADTLIGSSGKNTYNAGGDDGDTDDSKSNPKSVLSPSAAAPVVTEQATPLAVYGTRTGLTPAQIRSQYGFGNLSDTSYTNRGEGQAVAVVIPFSVGSIRTSVNTFSTEFSLPQTDTNNFAIINAGGDAPAADPDPFNGWEAEAALQLEWVHAIAPKAQLYLVLADSDLFTDLFAAVNTAVDTLVSRHGGGVCITSFGSQIGELNPNLEAYLDQSFTRKAAKTVSFVTGSGDASTTSYPSVSPYEVSIGGTSLIRDTNGNLTGRETAWSLSGGGTSSNYPTPGYQSTLGFATRATPDFSFNADPASGYAFYSTGGFGDVDGDGTNDTGWLPGGAGGTSAAVPIAAGMLTLANEQRRGNGRSFLGINANDAIYDLAVSFPNAYFNDITTGTSGNQSAGQGYDLVTGFGSPKAQLLIDRLASAGTVPLATNRVEFSAEYEEPITKIGPVSTPAGGFINGIGAVSGNNIITLQLTPDPGRTPTAANPQADTNIFPGIIQVSNFQPVTFVRNADNTFIGISHVTVLIYLAPNGDNSFIPQPIPKILIPGSVGLVNPDDTVVTGPTIHTHDMDLFVTGKIVRDKRGKEQIVGEFDSPNTDGDGPAVRGDDPWFHGTFKSY